MAPRVKKPKDDEEGGPAQGSNVPDGNKVLKFIEKVEALDGDLATERSEYMNRCKAIHSDKKEVFKEAKAAGVNKKALKGHVEKRKLEGKIEEIANDLEGDDNDAYVAMELALEKLKEAA